MPLHYNWSCKYFSTSVRNEESKISEIPWRNLVVLIGIAAIYPTRVFNLVSSKFFLKHFHGNFLKLTRLTPKNESPKRRILRTETPKTESLKARTTITGTLKKRHLFWCLKWFDFESKNTVKVPSRLDKNVSILKLHENFGINFGKCLLLSFDIVGGKYLIKVTSTQLSQGTFTFFCQDMSSFSNWRKRIP